MKITIPTWITQLKEYLTRAKLESTLNKLSKNPKSKELVSLVKKKLKSKNHHPTSNVMTIVSSLVGLVVTLSIGFMVLGQLKAASAPESAAYNASTTVTNNLLTTLPSFVGIFITVAIAMSVLGLFYSR